MTLSPSERDLLANLLFMQSETGAFLSDMQIAGSDIWKSDETAFVTAQVAMILNRILRSRSVKLDPIIRVAMRLSLDTALDFIETCEEPEKSGMFFRYSSDQRGSLASDSFLYADDTALCWSALVAAGRRTKAQASGAVLRNFIPLAEDEEHFFDAPFSHQGGVRSWKASLPENPIDICTNINIMLVCQICGIDQSEVALGTGHFVDQTLSIIGGDQEMFRKASPFYTDATELGHALIRLSASGMQKLDALAEPWIKLDIQDNQLARPVSREIFCELNRIKIWRSPALQMARQCQDVLFSDEIISDDAFVLDENSLDESLAI